MQITDLFEHKGPFFVRKINKKSDWEHENHGETIFVSVANAIFGHHPENKFSLYRIETEFDLQAVIVGLSGRRLNVQNMDVISFSERELESAARIETTPGDTSCDHVNNLHVDIAATPEALIEICRNAQQNGRKATRISKKTIIKPVIEFFRNEIRCNAVEDDSACEPCDNNNQDIKTWASQKDS